MSKATIQCGVVATIAMVTVSLLGGCSHSQQERMGMLEDENYELRGRNQQLQASLDEAQQGRTLLDQEVKSLKADNEKLQFASTSIGQPTAAVDTGFEQLPGVSTSTNTVGEIVVAVAGDVLFDPGKTVLKSSAKKTLTQIAGVLNDRYPDRMIRVAGHTDTDPIKKSKWGTNERLSAERALAVEEFLKKNHVDGARMYSAAYGPSQPKGTKKSSRRVEIVVLNLPAG